MDGDERASLDLAQELGLEMLPVNNPDGTILRGEFIPDTWGQGLDRLPYPQSVRESFKKCRKDLGAIEVEDRERELELDNEPFSKYFHGYGPDQTRGYLLYVSAPGTFTRVQPVSRRPMERIVFANTDSEGPLSSTDRGIVAARRAVRQAERILARGPSAGARNLASKARSATKLRNWRS